YHVAFIVAEGRLIIGRWADSRPGQILQTAFIQAAMGEDFCENRSGICTEIFVTDDIDSLGQPRIIKQPCNMTVDIGPLGGPTGNFFSLPPQIMGGGAAHIDSAPVQPEFEMAGTPQIAGNTLVFRAGGAEEAVLLHQ